jgi:hypothetical protein
MSFYVKLLVCFLKVLYSLFIIKIEGASILQARILEVSAYSVVTKEVGVTNLRGGRSKSI